MKKQGSGYNQLNIYLNHLIILVLGVFIFGFIMFEAVRLMQATQTLTTVNSRWIKAQKQALSELYIYAFSDDDDNFENYQFIMVDVLSMRLALAELNTPDPDDEFVSEGFELMEMDQDTIENMRRLFRLYGGFEFLKKIFSEWDDYSENLDDLIDLGEELYLVKNNPSEFEKSESLDVMLGIYYLDSNLMYKTNDLMMDLNESSQEIKSIIFRIIIIFLAILIVYALFMVISFIKMQRLLDSTIQERKRLANFPLHNPSPVLEIRNDGTISYCNDASNRLFPNIETLGNQHPFLETIIQDILLKKFTSEDVRVYENSINGRYFEQVVHHVNHTDTYHMYAFDVTTINQSRAKLQEMLDDKTALLAEVHHRVKNNLAIISSLVQMEIFATENQPAIMALKRSQSRIHTMAALHEKIYEQKDFSKIDFGEYLNQKIHELIKTHINPECELDLNFNICPVLINVNQAIPLAMFCNEVLGNACKHAFKYRKTGLLEVSFIESDGTVYLSIKDDGPGIPGVTSLQTADSLGLTLAYNLASQLEAKTKMECDGGTEISINFSLKNITGAADTYFTERVLA